MTQTVPARVVTEATATSPPPEEFATSLAVTAWVDALLVVVDMWHADESPRDARDDTGEALAP